ncbi:hypothetical protein Tco_0034196 [Tanacetum coccineum]
MVATAATWQPSGTTWQHVAADVAADVAWRGYYPPAKFQTHDQRGTDIETVVYADSDHAEDYVDRKSTNGIYMFVGCCLTSWFSKKQTVLAISTTEAEYVRIGKACQQALWMKQALIDYDV